MHRVAGEWRDGGRSTIRVACSRSPLVALAAVRLAAVCYPSLTRDAPWERPLTRRDLALLPAFAAALLFATGPRLDLVVEGCLAYVALAAWRPVLGLAGVAASLPFYALPPAHLNPPLGATEAALVLGALGVAGRWLLERTGMAKTRLVRFAPTAFDGPAALFLLAGLASLLVSEYLTLSLRELRLLVLEPVAFYYLLASVARDPKEVRKVVEGFLLGALGVALLGVGQTLSGLGATEAEGVRRAVGTFGSPNHLGLHLGRALPFLLAGLLWYRGPRQAGYALAGLGVGAGLAATFSLGAWLGVGAAAVAIGVAYARVTPRHRRRLGVAAAAALVALAALAVPLGRVERFAARLDPGQGTTFFRLQLWSASLAMIRDHPVLGIGLDNFLYLYQQRYLPEAAIGEPNLSHPHNLMFHFWLQLGLPGLAAAAWLLARFVRLAHRAFELAASPLARALSLGAAASMLDFVVHGLVDNSYFLTDLSYLFWLALAVVHSFAPRSLDARPLATDAP